MSNYSFSPTTGPVHHEADLTASLEDLDPSICDGYRVVYEREVPCECRTRQSGEEARQGVLESLKVKMLLLGSDEAPASIRIELSSEADLFFHYLHVLDESEFPNVQASQKLMIEFYDYPNVLTRMLNGVIRDPHIHLCIFTMTVGAADGRLDFIQNMDYKVKSSSFASIMIPISNPTNLN